MKKRMLGKTGIELSEVGYGCAALWGKDILGKQALTEDKAYEVFAVALKSSISFFDTGFNYGYAEERLGRCIKRAVEEKIIDSRTEIVLETKCGETLNPDGTYGEMNWSPDWIKKSLEIQLKRLKTDYIDLYAIHGECPKKQLGELLKTFESLKTQGVIRAYGANSFNVDYLTWIAKEKCFDYVMPDYNIMRQEREPLIEILVNSGVGVIAGSALGESLYSKSVFGIKTRNDFWYLARAITRFRDLMSKSKDFRFLTKQKDYTANQLALRYVLDNPMISSAVFSTTRTDHLLDNLRAIDIEMPDSIKREIKRRS